jgi:hypothetical protein
MVDSQNSPALKRMFTSSKKKGDDNDDVDGDDDDEIPDLQDVPDYKDEDGDNGEEAYNRTKTWIVKYVYSNSLGFSELD